MSVTRKQFLYDIKKAGDIERVYDETTPIFSPKINNKSKILDKSHTRDDRSGPRTDVMHAYREKYDQHKEQLRQELSNKEVEGFTFEPKLNTNSVRLVKDTNRNFTDRTMG